MPSKEFIASQALANPPTDLTPCGPLLTHYLKIGDFFKSQGLLREFKRFLSAQEKGATVPDTFKINEQDEFGRSCLHYLCEAPRAPPEVGSISESLKNVKYISNELQGTWIKCLMKCGAEVNLPDNFGETPLHVVCRVGSEGGFDTLKKKADFSRLTNEGKTCLHLVCENGHKNLTKKPQLASREALNARDNNGRTPLHYGSVCSDRDSSVIIIRFLLTTGADPTLVDDDGNNPLAFSTALGFTDVSELLRPK